ncbi:Formyl-CoA:oxalate CoA-transferase [compost metagenome]
MQDDYLRETGFFNKVEHPTEGELVMTSIPVQFSSSPGNVRYLPPNLGEHSQEVLGEIGYSPDQIEKLCAPRAPVSALAPRAAATENMAVEIAAQPRS